MLRPLGRKAPNLPMSHRASHICLDGVNHSSYLKLFSVLGNYDEGFAMDKKVTPRPAAAVGDSSHDKGLPTTSMENS